MPAPPDPRERNIAVQELTPEGRQVLDEAARRHGVSPDAVLTLLRALVAGGGSQAQFNHPDLGGMGQWSQGGMIMVGDMFNQGLKARVDALCSELAGLLRSQPLFAAARPAQSQSQQQSSGMAAPGAGVSLFVPGQGGSSGAWWPAELGSPAASGSQNSTRYATFPSHRRLAIEQGGQVTVYDTGDHHITGFSQQQGGGQSLTFTSQHGLVRVADLPVVGPQAASAAVPLAASEAPSPRAQVPPPIPPQASASPGSRTPTAPGASADDPLAKLERLAELHQKGILTQEEFAAKKAELLSRL